MSNVITPVDDTRLPLYQSELLQALYNADGNPEGHGLSQDDVTANRGYFSVNPILDKPIRMIVLDTADENERSLGRAQQGSMDAVQFSWLHEMLVEAEGRQELVIIVSHHRLEDFHDLSEVAPEMIRELLASSDNVILHLTGHGHRDTKTLNTLNGKGSYWELMTASTIDFPLQSRIVELVDERNGFLSIYITNFDHNSDQATLADEARQLAAGKLAFGTTGFDGDTMSFWKEEVKAQNLLLRVALQEEISDNLAAIEDWPGTIDSVETLSAF